MFDPDAYKAPLDIDGDFPFEGKEWSAVLPGDPFGYSIEVEVGVSRRVFSVRYFGSTDELHVYSASVVHGRDGNRLRDVKFFISGGMDQAMAHARFAQIMWETEEIKAYR